MPKTEQKKPSLRKRVFNTLAIWTIQATGGSWGFSPALAVVLLWAATGPYFHYSENWQLSINLQEVKNA